MIVDHCMFPDDLLYDLDSNAWVRFEEQGRIAVVGVTSVLAALANKFSSVRLKLTGISVAKGRSLGTLESLRFVGPIPSPLSGRIVSTNPLVEERPKLINDSPYLEGWIARLQPSNLAVEKQTLLTVNDAEPFLKELISKFKVRCFKAFPDHEMVEIGSECSAVLVRLNELIEKIADGDVVHIVSDDPTAYVEMVRWSDQTGQSLADWRAEGNLFHFLVRKEK